MEPRFTRTTRIQAAQDLVCSDLKGETVLLNLASGNYYGLDEVGSRVWSLLHDSTTFEALFDTLLDEYDVPPRQCESDLRSLLSRLWKAGVIIMEDT